MKITIMVEEPEPRADIEGAVDYPVRVTVANVRGTRYYSGQVTFGPDRDGGWAPVGDSLDCWISSDVHDFVIGLHPVDRRRVLDALESGPGITELEFDLDIDNR